MEEISQETKSLIISIGKVAGSILLGMVGKFSMDKAMGKKMTWPHIISSLGIGLFVGVICHGLLMKSGHEAEASYGTAAAAMFSKEIMVAIYATDWKKTIADILKYWSDKFKR